MQLPPPSLRKRKIDSSFITQQFEYSVLARPDCVYRINKVTFYVLRKNERIRATGEKSYSLLECTFRGRVLRVIKV